jgi:hypothetical protein
MWVAVVHNTWAPCYVNMHITEATSHAPAVATSGICRSRTAKPAGNARPEGALARVATKGSRVQPRALPVGPRQAAAPDL